jgi:hypothetical protein
MSEQFKDISAKHPELGFFAEFLAKPTCNIAFHEVSCLYIRYAEMPLEEPPGIGPWVVHRDNPEINTGAYIYGSIELGNSKSREPRGIEEMYSLYVGPYEAREDELDRVIEFLKSFPAGYIRGDLPGWDPLFRFFATRTDLIENWNRCTAATKRPYLLVTSH